MNKKYSLLFLIILLTTFSHTMCAIQANHCESQQTTQSNEQKSAQLLALLQLLTTAHSTDEITLEHLVNTIYIRALITIYNYNLTNLAQDFTKIFAVDNHNNDNLLKNLLKHYQMNEQELKNFKNMLLSRYNQVTTIKNNDNETGKKKHQCPQCNKTFTQKSRLTRHMTTHTDERPYQCSQCNKAFTRDEYLKKHIKNHINQQSWPCNQCQTFGESLILKCKKELLIKAFLHFKFASLF